VLLVTAAAYLRCLANAFVFDDNEMIVDNRYIGQWSFLWKSFVHDSWWFRDPQHLPQSSYYRPLQDLWLALHYYLFGLNPTGWHATMIALHLVAVCLVFLIAIVLSGRPLAATVAALVFGLLPIHTEAIVWPAAIPLPLAATLELAAFYLFIRRGSSRLRLAWSLVLYALALLSHESAVAFPGLIAAYAFWLQPHDSAPPASRKGESAGDSTDARPLIPRLRRTTIAVAPYAALMFAYLGLRLLILGFISRPNFTNHATTAQVLMTVPIVLVHYLVLLVFPLDAGPSHRVLLVTNPLTADFLVPTAFLALAVVAAVLFFMRAPRRRFYLFCAAWIALGLVPEMNLGGLFVSALVQDRYLYLPSAGLCFVLGDLAGDFAHRSHQSRTVVYAAAFALGAIYAVVLFKLEYMWHDEVTLFSRCVRDFPESSLWHNRLGMALEQRGDITGAERELETANRLQPHDGAILFDLGQLHGRIGRYRDGLREITEALSLLPHPPPSAYLAAATIATAAGDAPAAETALDQAAALPGGFEEAALTRAEIDLFHRDAAAARQVLEPLEQRYPSDPRLWSLLGGVSDMQGDPAAALTAYQHAIALEPAAPTPHFLAARVLHEMGRDDDALAEGRLALAASPGDPNIRALLRQIHATNHLP